jgi:NTE family protein
MTSRAPAWPRIAFVLPGGGSAGAVQVGILRSLLEAGVYPDVLVGCSVGALNAACLALRPTLDQVARMEEMWAGVGTGDVFGSGWHRAALRLVARRDHLCSPAPLRTLIRSACPVRDLSDLAVPLHVATTDLDHGVARWWTTGPAEDILYASACLPGLFPPAILDGVRHVDGGVLEPVPVMRAVDLDAARVYVIGEAADPHDQPAVARSALEVLLRSFAISRYGRLPHSASLARPGQEVIEVPGASTAGIPITDFSSTGWLMAESRATSRAFIRQYRLGASTR